MGRLAGVRRIVSSQRAIDAWQKPWHHYLDSFTLQFCDEVIVNSLAAEALVRKRAGIRSSLAITRIANGVDLTRFVSGDRAAARRALSLPEGVVIAGSLMRLHAEKGADFIVSFAEATLTQHPELHLAVGGVGPMEADTALAKPRNRLRHARLHWLGWVDDTPTFYSALDAFWLLSRRRKFSTKACSKPVLHGEFRGSRRISVGVSRDLLGALARGTLFPAGQPVKAADAIGRFDPTAGMPAAALDLEVSSIPFLSMKWFAACTPSSDGNRAFFFFPRHFFIPCRSS